MRTAHSPAASRCCKAARSTIASDRVSRALDQPALVARMNGPQLLLMGESMQNHRHFDRAVALLSAALRAMPQRRDDLTFAIGRSYFGNEQFAQAQQTYLRGAAIDGHSEMEGDISLARVARRATAGRRPHRRAADDAGAGRAGTLRRHRPRGHATNSHATQAAPFRRGRGRSGVRAEELASRSHARRSLARLRPRHARRGQQRRGGRHAELRSRAICSTNSSRTRSTTGAPAHSNRRIRPPHSPRISTSCAPRSRRTLPTSRGSGSTRRRCSRNLQQELATRDAEVARLDRGRKLARRQTGSDRPHPAVVERTTSKS